MGAVEGRHALLLRSLGRTGTARLTELAEEMDVSIATLRRDVELLSRQGRLTRRHGTVELSESGGRIPRPSRTTPAPAIGMMHAENRYLGLIAQAAHRDAERRDHRFLVERVENVAEARAAARRLVDAGCIGLVYAPQWRTEADVDEPVPWMLHLGVPVVLGGREVGPDHPLYVLDSVIADHAYGFQMALDHLQALGHTRIMASFHDESPPGRMMRTYYLDQIERRGLPRVGPPLVTPEGVDPAATETMVRAIRDARATAIVVHTDIWAQLLVRALRRSGTAVPGDVSVVAYDDIVTPEVDLALTSISPPKHPLGVEAVALLMRRHRLARAGLGQPPIAHVRLLPELVVRTSTGAAPDPK